MKSRLERIVVINDLAKAQGGASQLALASASGFAQAGIPVTLLCGDAGEPRLASHGIEVCALGQQRLLSAGRVPPVLRGLWNPAARRMVAQWIARNDTPGTVYHVHGWSQILSPALFAALRPVRQRTVMHAHDFFLTCPNGALFDYRKGAACPHRPMSMACLTTDCDRRGRANKLWRVIRQALQDRAMALGALPPQLLIHGAMGPLLARSGVPADRMLVLPNPVVPYLGEPVAAERNHGVLFVGRMEATKGIDLAAHACRLARARLVAVGDGALLPALRLKYPEMRWVGRKTHAEIGALAKTCRMQVMPSRHIEPFGLAAIEGLWSGLPVLSSAQSLIAPDITAAGAGLSIDPTDVTGFAAAITRLMDDDALTARMSRAAHERTRHLALSPDRWIAALLDAYHAMLEGGPRAVAALHPAAFAGALHSGQPLAPAPLTPFPVGAA